MVHGTVWSAVHVFVQLEGGIRSLIVTAVQPCSSRFCPVFFFFSSRRRHTRSDRDWSSDVCSSDLGNQRFPDDTTDRATNKYRLVRQRCDTQLRWNRGLNLGQERLDAGDYVQG